MEGKCQQMEDHPTGTLAHTTLYILFSCRPSRALSCCCGYRGQRGGEARGATWRRRLKLTHKLPLLGRLRAKYTCSHGSTPVTMLSSCGCYLCFSGHHHRVANVGMTLLQFREDMITPYRYLRFTWSHSLSVSNVLI